MPLSKETIEFEKKYLKLSLKEINNKIEKLGANLQIEEVNIREFKKFIWQNKGSMDEVEIRSNLLTSEMDSYLFENRANYLKKLYRLKKSPYFGRIDFKEEGDNREHIIYIGITHLTKGTNNLIYDWRAPISSMFYDYEVGSALYEAPEVIIKGEIINKRQYKIKDGKLIHIFDNNINITDDFLQEVLTHASSDKMKNIVNTIQKEQNEVIRDISNKVLIVQGVAGSGKTSVALHRIAFLLYKLKNLSSNNVLIFSPNNIFSDYISNVLPELGEANALETTFSDFTIKYINKYKKIESFSEFIERYYIDANINKELTTFKMSDEMITVIDNYVDDLIKSTRFINNVIIDIDIIPSEYEKEDLNDLFHNRYSRLTLFERIESISSYICNRERKSYKKYGRTINNKLWSSLNIKKDIKKIFKELFKSEFFIKTYGKKLSDQEINSFVNRKILYYEDLLLYIYLQGKLQSFPYSSLIKQIVIDEAQDYSKLQYIILKRIFPRASFTILGDINQNINPYYSYKSLEALKDVFGNIRYLELTKTYRSSPEIIEYSNKIMDLKHIVSIRKSNNYPVIENNPSNIYKTLKRDIIDGKRVHKKIAIITKTKEEAEYLYYLLKDDFSDINYLSETSIGFKHDLVIIPSYLAKGLEFDLVIVYTDKENIYRDDEKTLFYVAVTRAQHELKVYNQK